MTDPGAKFAKMWYARSDAGCDEKTLAMLLSQLIAGCEYAATVRERDRIAANLGKLVTG